METCNPSSQEDILGYFKASLSWAARQSQKQNKQMSEQTNSIPSFQFDPAILLVVWWGNKRKEDLRFLVIHILTLAISG